MSDSVLVVEHKLKSAVKNVDLVTVRALLQEHEFLRTKQYEENSLFHQCLRNHEREVVQVFLAEDSFLGHKTGYSAAHRYAESDNSPRLANLLTMQPDLLNATDSYGNTPLHLAATHGYVNIIEYLYHQGADFSLENSDHNTPLNMALLFDQHPEKNAAKYIINQTCANQNLDIQLLLNPVQLTPAPGVSNNNALKTIDQQGWDALLQKYFTEYYGYNGVDNATGAPVSVQDLLYQAGYFPTVKNINIGSSYMLNNMDFSELNFDACKFSGTFSHVKFAAGLISNSEFDHAYFNHAEFASHADFINTSFSDTYFHNTKFNQNNFSDALFSYATFDNTTVAGANFDNVFVSHSNFLGLTLSQPQKFQVVMDNSVFTAETDQLLGNTMHTLHTDAPIIGLISSPYEIIYGGEVGMTGADPYARLKQYGATPVLLNMQSISENINAWELATEIKTILATIPTGENIPQYLLSQHGENLDKIKAMANQYAEHLDAAWIPGGPDVHPEFYGHENTESYTSTYNYPREIFEFALIDHMVTHNKPLMGVCHGSQITNVYFGGTLKQDVDGHYGKHVVLPIHANASSSSHVNGVVSEVLLKPTMGVSAHHQSIDKLGEGLQVVAVSGPAIENFIESGYDYAHNIQTVIEASEGIDGKPVMLFQFHPEYNLDNTNRDILFQFVDLAKQSHNLAKQAPVLDFHDMLTANTTTEVIGQAIGQPSLPAYIPELASQFLHNYIYTEVI